MEMMLAVLGVAFVAFAVWGIVRLVNRPKMPGPRFYGCVVLAGLALYPLSFGPACWFAWNRVEKTGTAPSPWIGLPYYPLGQLTAYGPTFIAAPLRSYAGAFVDKGSYLYLPIRWRKWDISNRR